MMKKFQAHKILFLIVALGTLTGCQVGPSSVAYVGTLDATLAVDRNEGRIGEPVKIIFTVKNVGREPTGKPEIIELKSKPVMDIVVGYAMTDYVRWSQQQPSDTDLYRLTLLPNQSKTISLTWVPDERAYGKPVVIQGILHLEEERTDDVRVLLPVK